MSDGITVAAKLPATVPTQTFTEDNTTPIAGLLGLNTHAISTQDSQVLQSIYEFLRGDALEMTQLEILAKLRNLENRLGVPGLGERRLDKIARYVKLQSQIDKITAVRDGELR